MDMEYNSNEIKQLLQIISTAITHRNQDILRRRKAGETLQAIADVYGLSRQRVHMIIRKELSHDNQDV
jgi:DNA-directed RNA polymerase sigma subunit (sigma70/sigma32)